MKPKGLLMAISVLLTLSVMGVSTSNNTTSSRASATATVTVSSYCTVVAESYLTLHLADNDGNPIPNATLILNGTFNCMPAPPDYRLDQSINTDTNGDASFVVVPYAKYNVTVILHPNMTVVIGQITAPMPTSRSIITVTCTPSANLCTAGSTESSTRTTAEAVTKTPDEFSVFLGIMIVIVLGVILIVAVRKIIRGT